MRSPSTEARVQDREWILFTDEQPTVGASTPRKAPLNAD
jgi:hypothetical protein